MDTDFDREFKDRLLDMFKWFHNICVENNIRYYALGGTLLGAVRHEGFIPWDDDIDVGLPRSDYEKLIHILEKHPNKRYVIETPLSDKEDFHYTYSKIYDTQTTLIERSKRNIKRGLFLDIFPLDGLANTFEESKKKFSKINMLNKYYLTRVTSIRRDRSWYKNVAVVLGRLIPNIIITDKAIQKKINRMCKENSFDDCIYVGNLLGHWGIKEVTEKSVVGSPELYKFEDTVIYGIQDYDTYLTRLYGDWCKLPPIEEQKSEHDFVLCDLHKSYLDK